MRYLTMTIAVLGLFYSSCDFDRYAVNRDEDSVKSQPKSAADARVITGFDGNGGVSGTTAIGPLDFDSGLECGPGEVLCGVECVPNDAKNCGTCGHDCTTLPHVVGSVECDADGECVVTEASCAPGWAHCSSRADDGCETDITQPANCGGCENDCSAGSEKLCAPREAESSEQPTYECTSECPAHAPTLCGDNSCIDTNSSTNHCGECENPCPQTEHGEPICVEGECELDCDEGYHQCDDDCLSDTSTDSCGALCEPCEVPPNSDPECDGSECGYTCKEGFLSCDELCLANDAKNCGSCGHDCTNLPNVSGSVDCDETGACVVPAESCTTGYAHCSSDIDDGCETDLSSTETCGSCDNRCPATAPICSLAPGSTPEQPVYECATGCNNPDAPYLCSGSCVNVLTSATNCGTCGRVCTGVPNGRPDCTGGNCVIVCNNGFHLCDNSCLDNASPDSCGSRCGPCPSGSYAHATCNNGVCGYECDSPNYLKCGDASCVPSDAVNCGACGNSCASGQRCASGQCVCDSVSCPNGCCDGAEQCRTPSANTCGLNGADCRSCASGQRCASGQCVCDSVSCPNGCCDSAEQCRTPSTNTCGLNGADCRSCASGQRCASGQCVCDSVSCPSGCCDAGQCRTSSTTSCGLKGELCENCATTDEYCYNGDCVECTTNNHCTVINSDYVCQQSTHTCIHHCGDGVIQRTRGEDCEVGVSGWTSVTCSAATCLQRIYWQFCVRDDDCSRLPVGSSNEFWGCAAGRCILHRCELANNYCPSLPGYTTECVYYSGMGMCDITCDTNNDCPIGLECLEQPISWEYACSPPGG
ncbi:MAG: hypothetical protein JXA30_18535 [Deltaproteobacteria bacterium]|nr:hypothetical protein [Deltaproteobacteria bacterium]